MEILTQAIRDREHREFKRQASLAGVDLGPEKNTKFEEIARRVEEKISKNGNDLKALAAIGVDVEVWD